MKMILFLEETNKIRYRIQQDADFLVIKYLDENVS